MRRPLKARDWRTLTALCVIALIPLGVLVRPYLPRLPPTWRLDIQRERNRKRGCSLNMHQLWLAMQLYSQDHDGRLPPVVVGGTAVAGWHGIVTNKGLAPFPAYKGSPVGWADATLPYFYSESLFMCPAQFGGATNVLFPAEADYTDYWMNGNLSGLRRNMILSPSSTLLLGEGNDGVDMSNAAYSKTALPPSWLSDEKSPAYRHLGGANYLMADGTVHWLKPDQVTTFGGRKDAFAVK